MTMKTLWERAYILADEIGNVKHAVLAGLNAKDLEGALNDLNAKQAEFAHLIKQIEEAEKDARVSCIMAPREDRRRVSEIFC